MKKFAALTLVLALTASVPALAQGSYTGPRDNSGLSGGPGPSDRRYGDDDDRGPPPPVAGRPDASPNFRQGGWDRPDAVGRTAAFFSHPRLDGRSVEVQYFNGYRNNARQAEERATDNFCRRVGYREGAYYSVDRSRRGAVLEDVLCIR